MLIMESDILLKMEVSIFLNINPVPPLPNLSCSQSLICVNNATSQKYKSKSSLFSLILHL